MSALPAFAETETSTRPYAIAAMESTAPETFYEPTEEGVEGPRPAKAGIMNYIYSHLHTHADVTGSYNDNIYLINRPKKGDFVTTVTPGISYRIGDDRPTREGRLKSYFEIDTGYKVDYYTANNINFNKPYVTVSLRGAGDHYLTEFNYTYMKDILTRQLLDSGSEGMLGVARTMADLKFQYDWNRIGAEMRYKLYQTKYDDIFKTPSSIRDNSIRGLVWVSPSFTPKTRFYFEYDYGIYDYYYQAVNNVNDFKYHQFWLGARGSFTKKLTGDIKVGKELRFGYVSIGKYKDSLLINFKLQYRYSQKLAFGLNALSDARPSTSIGAGLDSSYSFFLYTVYRFNPQVMCTGGLSYDYDSYKTAREDNTYGAMIKLDYLVNRWTTVGIGYTFKTRDSERAGAKYNNSIITGRLAMVF